ncbi:MAG: hypothetical protein HC880_10170 [Bacteroidia bacterium]|nr:hypothetical protein [Bacteroidia bacterium]
MILLTLPTMPAPAQQGDLHIHNYHPDIPNASTQNLAVTQDKRGVMYFANTQGVMSYDGIRWEIINTPGTPYALATNPQGNEYIYVGSRGAFGYLYTDLNGQRKYQPILQKESKSRHHQPDTV